MLDAALLLRAALDAITGQLRDAGIEEPKREARLLAAGALRLSLSDLILRENEPIGPHAPRLADWLARRLEHEPVSRMAGEREFYGLTLHLNKATLDPRPDTETLVEAVLAEAQGEGFGSAPRILDLGTGTGAILLALLSALPAATGLGVDIAPEAVAGAAANARRLGLDTRAAFRSGDLFEGLAETFPMIVSNPPYIPSKDIPALDPEVRLHDPLRALDGGTDGLDFYRRIADDAPRFLAPGGLLAVEVGQGQAEDVASLFAAVGLRAGGIRHDLAGIERVVCAFRP